MAKDVVLGVEEMFDDIDGKRNCDPFSRWAVIKLVDAVIEQPVFY